jgi:hypothetical protein
LTAIGTVGAVIVAVGIALWTERRSDRRLCQERERNDRALAEQRKQAEAALEDERAYGRVQLEDERRIARERAAHPGLRGAGRPEPAPGQKWRAQPVRRPRQSKTWRLTAIVVNHGAYTIQRAEVQFCIGKSLTPQHRYERVPGFGDLTQELRGGGRAASELPLRGVLTPFDKGMLFETDRRGRPAVGRYPNCRDSPGVGVLPAAADRVR